eukprot:gnl/MRDRNA2_/MRDRNA2_90162_c0_seq1.p1 gnl/MRDRNA2_/MRDRNA2_90162_c0~~gnl/MRDRNA2_/MRDRNA2_90162_c0_seq1.p1  ORF type:complete len:317 (-),score=71.41 gnl/MRDRNA2_/MRDRNA2_90162_c0_seq1:17-967(-)
MMCMNIFLIFIAETLHFSAAFFVAKRGSFKAQAAGPPFAHLLDDFNEKIKMKSLQNRTTVLQGDVPSAYALSLRLKPEYFNELVSYFEYLDTNHDKTLSELEFMQVAKYDKSLQEEGRHAYDLFSAADGKTGMNLQEFVRLVAVVTKVPDGFDYRADDLKAVPSSSVAEDQDRDALMRLFIVFDENTSGEVDEAEFEKGWMGPTLWTLRKENILSQRWLVSNAEFEYAKGAFQKSAGADNALNLGEFAQLLKDAIPHRGDHNNLKGGEARESHPCTTPNCKGMRAGPRVVLGSTPGMNTLTSLLITFTFGTLMSWA